MVFSVLAARILPLSQPHGTAECCTDSTLTAELTLSNKMKRKTPVWYYYYKKGFQMRSRAWRWTGPSAQKRSWARRLSWAAKVGLLLLRVVPQQRSATDIVTAQARQLKQHLRSAQVAGQRRGDTALTLPLFWWRSTVFPVFFGRCPRSSLHSFAPPPSPSLWSILASVYVKQNGLFGAAAHGGSSLAMDPSTLPVWLIQFSFKRPSAVTILGLCKLSVSHGQTGAHTVLLVGLVGKTRSLYYAGQVAQRSERRTRDRKVAGLCPRGKNDGRIFFSLVNFLCWLISVSVPSPCYRSIT